MKRHIARMANTDQKVVVVFMQIPDRADHALVVAVDNLPPRWEQHVMQIVESPEGQSDPDLGNVLNRRLMPDSTETVLFALHQAGLLLPVSIDRVIMFPEPNRPYALRQILQAMNRVVPDEYDAVDRLNESTSAKHVANQVGQQRTPVDPYATVADTKFNPHTANQDATVSEGNAGIANGLLIEAEMLESEARAKREKAYTYAPHLRPQVKKSLRAAAPIEAAPAPVATKAPAKAPAKRAAPARKKASN
jgi:hypothetical protein